MRLVGKRSLLKAPGEDRCAMIMKTMALLGEKGLNELTSLGSRDMSL